MKMKTSIAQINVWTVIKAIHARNLKIRNMLSGDYLGPGKRRKQNVNYSQSIKHSATSTF
jgi:hypothetical protein